MEMRCNRHLLHIYYKDHITNYAIVCNTIQAAIGHYEEILTTVKNGNCDSLDTWSDAVASVKRSNKVQYSKTPDERPPSPTTIPLIRPHFV